jgi:hypothetical protein
MGTTAVPSSKNHVSRPRPRNPWGVYLTSASVPGDKVRNGVDANGSCVLHLLPRLRYDDMKQWRDSFATFANTRWIDHLEYQI